MEKFLVQLGIMSLQAAIIILIVCLFRVLLIRCRVPQNYVIYLWIVPFFFMVFPWKISSPIGFWREYTVIEQEKDNYKQIQNEVVSSGKISQQEHFGEEPVVEVPREISTQMSDAVVVTFDVHNYVMLVVYVVWLAGALAVQGYMLISVLQLKKRLACSVCEKGIYLAEDIAVPMVFGIIRPKIYLPTGMEELQKNFVISHENTHIMRKDPMKKVLAFGIVSIHWFNPLAWVAFTLLERDMEMACDEITVHRLGEGAKKAYAETLLYISADKRMRAHRLSVPLGFGEVDIKKRIKNILINKRTMRIVAVSVIAVCVGLTAIFLTKQGQVAEENEIQEIELISEPVLEKDSEQLVGEIPKVVYDAAESYTKNQFERVWKEYSKWKVSEIVHAYTYENFYERKLFVYQLGYEFLAMNPENIVLTGGMTMDEEGWVVPGYPNSVYLIFEERDEELIHLTTMMENDCEPGDEIFADDLEHKLLDAGVKIVEEKPIDITRRSITSDMQDGADGMEVYYADDERLICKDCYALYVYDLKNEKMLRQIDVMSIGCNFTQGDYYCDVKVSEDGSLVYLHPLHLSSMYVYDIEKDVLVKRVYETPKGIWEGLLLRSEYIESDFTACQSIFCVEVSKGAYGYLYGSSGLVIDTAWVVRDADGQETYTYLFKDAGQQDIELGPSFTMEMLIELVEGGNVYDKFQQMVWRNDFVYANFIKEYSEDSLTWKYICNMTYKGVQKYHL